MSESSRHSSPFSQLKWGRARFGVFAARTEMVLVCQDLPQMWKKWLSCSDPRARHLSRLCLHFRTARIVASSGLFFGASPLMSGFLLCFSSRAPGLFEGARSDEPYVEGEGFTRFALNAGQANFSWSLHSKWETCGGKRYWGSSTRLGKWLTWNKLLFEVEIVLWVCLLGREHALTRSVVLSELKHK